MTIGQVASAAGVNVETIRYYQRRRLIPVPRTGTGRMRRYDEADLGRVRFIKSAQRLGFSLDEVASLLRLEDGAHCAHARSVAEEKLRLVRARVVDLQRIEAALAALVCECRAATGRVRCPLIGALQGVGTIGAQ